MMSNTAVHANVQLKLSGGMPVGNVTLLAQDDDYPLSVVCDGQAQDLAIEGIDGSNAFVAQQAGTSQNMTMINGRTSSSVTYNYQVRPLQIGSYRIGPVSAIIDGRSEQSEAISVRVVDAETYDKQVGANRGRSSLQCQLSSDTPVAVVGQPVVITVLLEDDGDVQSRSLQPPSFGKLKFTPLGDPVSQQQLVNGQTRVQVRQQYSASADEPGTYTVGPAIAHFVIPDNDSGDPFSSFFGMRMGSFFGGGTKRSVRSNSVELKVTALPQTNEPVDGVGNFTSLVLETDKRVVDLNEPFTVRLKISGTGNFDAILAPPLQVPDYMTVYDSSSSFTAHGPHKGTKTFEYLVQIGQDGSHQLPSQEFSYFDTQTHSHRAIRSKVVSVQVKTAKAVPIAPVEKKKTVAPIAQDDEYEDEFFDDEEGSEHTALPWWWLMLLMLLPVIYLARHRLREVAFTVSERLGVTSQDKRDAQIITQMVKQDDVAGLHRFFTVLLADCWGCSSEQIDESFIEQQAAIWGWDLKKREAFAAFIALCGQAAFAPQLMSVAEKKALLGKAGYWHALVVQARGR